MRKNLKVSGILDKFEIDIKLVVKRCAKALDEYEHRGIPLAVIADYLTDEEIKLRYGKNMISAKCISIEDKRLEEYRKRFKNYTERIRRGQFILLNNIARRKLSVNINENIHIVIRT